MKYFYVKIMVELPVEAETKEDAVDKVKKELWGHGLFLSCLEASEVDEVDYNDV